MMPVRLIRLIAAALMISAFSLLPLRGALAEEGLNNTQRSEVELLIHDYLRENPEILLEAIQSLRDKQEMAQRNQAQSAVMDFNAQVADGLNAPSVGPADASVTVVEFFDYRCGYCKRVFADVQTLINSGDDIRFVFMEFPILGDDSLEASKAALAVWLNWPERYLDVHNALMGSRGNLTSDKTMDLISALGIDMNTLRTAMNSADVEKMIRDNHERASSMEINGTPAFIIGDELVPGAISLKDMKRLIDAARNN